MTCPADREPVLFPPIEKGERNRSLHRCSGTAGTGAEQVEQVERFPHIEAVPSPGTGHADFHPSMRSKLSRPVPGVVEQVKTGGTPPATFALAGPLSSAWIQPAHGLRVRNSRLLAGFLTCRLPSSSPSQKDGFLRIGAPLSLSFSAILEGFPI